MSTPRSEDDAGAADDGSDGTPRAGDFYIENGAWVFTAAYHLRRGYCCTNGCRHCPWRAHDGGE